MIFINVKTLSKRANSKTLQRRRSGFLIIVPLILSAFTHLWNPVGFPGLYIDESHYMRRAMQILDGLGPQESAQPYNENRQYDHPYFGQVLLAFALKIVGYPESFDPSPKDVSSIEMLYVIPRVFMGLLAVLDTLIVYQIARHRYNSNVALIASTLFAVMPLTWLLRRILLDTILLPFLLSSILIAVKYNISKREKKSYSSVSLILLSGTLFGLAAFTKIPALVFAPLVAYLIITAGKNMRWRTLGIWFIPVILIPTTWPVYAITYGQFDEWLDGISWQTSRNPRPLMDSVKSVLEIDPLLLVIGTLGILYASIRNDFLTLIWILPYLLFLHFIGYAQYIHMALLLPVFSIAAAALIDKLPSKLGDTKAYLSSDNATKKGIAAGQKRIIHFLDGFNSDPLKDMVEVHPPSKQKDGRGRLYPFVKSNIKILIFSALAIFGFVNTTVLISTYVNGSIFEATASLVDSLPDQMDANDKQNAVTLVSPLKWGIYFYWIPKYVFDKDIIFLDERSEKAPTTQKVISVARDTDMEDEQRIIGKVDNTARNFDYDGYPYNNMKYNELGDLALGANY